MMPDGNVCDNPHNFSIDELQLIRAYRQISVGGRRGVLIAVLDLAHEQLGEPSIPRERLRVPETTLQFPQALHESPDAVGLLELTV